MPDLHGKTARMDTSILKDLLGQGLNAPTCEPSPAPPPRVQSRMQPADLLNVLLPSPSGEEQERPLQLGFILCLPAGECTDA